MQSGLGSEVGITVFARGGTDDCSRACRSLKLRASSGACQEFRPCPELPKVLVTSATRQTKVDEPLARFTGDASTLRFDIGDVVLKPFHETYGHQSVYLDVALE
jgi:hypothetical protein